MLDEGDDILVPNFWLEEHHYSVVVTEWVWVLLVFALRRRSAALDVEPYHPQFRPREQEAWIRLPPT